MDPSLSTVTWCNLCFQVYHSSFQEEAWAYNRLPERLKKEARLLLLKRRKRCCHGHTAKTSHAFKNVDVLPSGVEGRQRDQWGPTEGGNFAAKHKTTVMAAFWDLTLAQVASWLQTSGWGGGWWWYVTVVLSQWESSHRAHCPEQTQLPLEVIRARCGTLFNFPDTSTSTTHLEYFLPSESQMRIRLVFSLKLLNFLDLILDQLSEKWSCKALPSLHF